MELPITNEQFSNRLVAFVSNIFRFGYCLKIGIWLLKIWIYAPTCFL